MSEWHEVKRIRRWRGFPCRGPWIKVKLNGFELEGEPLRGEHLGVGVRGAELNIQHSTRNSQCPSDGEALGCWTFLVGCWVFLLFPRSGSVCPFVASAKKGLVRRGWRVNRMRMGGGSLHSFALPILFPSAAGGPTALPGAPPSFAKEAVAKLKRGLKTSRRIGIDFEFRVEAHPKQAFREGNPSSAAKNGKFVFGVDCFSLKIIR